VTDYTTIPLTTGRIVISPLPPLSYMARVYPDDGPAYDRLTVASLITPEQLFLSGWLGEPLSVAEWRAAKAVMFPDARFVNFDRETERRGLRTVTLRI